MKGEKKNCSIRRFDDLGRIVIPREIRRLLQYHDGDIVEVGTVGQSIVIDRCQPLSYMAPICMQYLAAFAKSSNAACIICDTSNVVSPSQRSRSCPLLSGNTSKVYQPMNTRKRTRWISLGMAGTLLIFCIRLGKQWTCRWVLSFCYITVPLRKRNETVPDSLRIS